MIELLNCDCMEYMAGLNDKAFDLAIVDPPYGINADVAHNNNKGKNGYKLYRNTNWDSLPPTKEFWKELLRVSKNQIVFGGNYFTNFLPPSMGWVVWDKVQRLTTSDCELIFTSFNVATRVFQYARGLNQGFMNPARFHPTSKPVKLYKWLLHNYATKGDKILDTHLGSGSSAIAAHNMGFDFVGCEIDKDYYDAACKRFKEQTAQIQLFKP